MARLSCKYKCTSKGGFFNDKPKKANSIDEVGLCIDLQKWYLFRFLQDGFPLCIRNSAKDSYLLFTIRKLL